jgi:type IV pilus assembly protein PilC
MNESQEKPELKNAEDGLFTFHVRLRNRPWEAKTLTLEAPTKEVAVQKLFAQGYIVVSGREQDDRRSLRRSLPVKSKEPSAAQESKVSSFSFFQGVSARETIFFAVQLSTLLKAGIPLLRALEIIKKGIVNPFFRKVVHVLNKKVSEGGSFSNALRGYPKVFSWSWVNLTEVGETTGKLPECLEEIAHYQESSARIKQKVITAFFYPGALTVAVIGALTFLLLFVIPKFSAIFIAQKMELPVLTQIVVGISDLLRKQFLWVVGVVAAAVVGILYTRRIPAMKMEYDRVVLGAPMFGPILMQVAVVRFTKSLGTLLRSGVQILQALEIAGKLLENRYLEYGIRRVAHQVKSGQGLGSQLEARGLFPVFVTQLITVGEESGQLDRFLDLLAAYYEEQVDTFLARLTTLLEPVMLIFMGGVIGTIVIAMFLPIIELSTGGGAGV